MKIPRLIVSILLLMVGWGVTFCTTAPGRTTTVGEKIVHKRGPDPYIAIRHFEDNLGPAKDCADPLVKGLTHPVGHITVQWTVDDKGQVLDPMVTENTLKDDGVGECFLKLLRALKFPPTPEFTKTTVLYTFKYTTSEEVTPSSGE
ncbi:MAG: AgmX/PglI C-terminal domain-containing protein [Bdellovibrionales bacterium]|nr:AgmX/PglI C-terminal domain-containing protein [Bdellovibrionales bacterium]